MSLRTGLYSERMVMNVLTTILSTALIWQLMRAYTLSILSRLANTGNPIIEKEIVQWVNSKLQSAGKRTSLKSFQDPAIADGKIIIDLIDTIKPGSINYDNVRDGGNPEENLENAKYAVSMARKIGARVYALPEDITEVKAKMIMTVFACLMAMDYVPNMDSAKSAPPVAAVVQAPVPQQLPQPPVDNEPTVAAPAAVVTNGTNGNGTVGDDEEEHLQEEPKEASEESTTVPATTASETIPSTSPTPPQTNDEFAD